MIADAKLDCPQCGSAETDPMDPALEHLDFVRTCRTCGVVYGQADMTDEQRAAVADLLAGYKRDGILRDYGLGETWEEVERPAGAAS